MPLTYALTRALAAHPPRGLGGGVGYWAGVPLFPQSNAPPPSLDARFNARLNVPRRARRNTMETSTQTLTSSVSLAVAAASWLVSLGSAGVARGPATAASVALWCAFHVVAARLYKGLQGDRMIGGYPGWSWATSLLHGGVALPMLFALCMWLLPPDRRDFTAFLSSRWDTGAHMQPLEQAHAAILGYMLKDYGLSSSSVEVGYAIHHTIAILGCALCLLMPGAAGLTSLNGIQ